METTYTTRLNRNLEMELIVPRQGKGKQLYTFDQNYERLRAEGFDRNPFPWEVFSLLAKNLEGKLNGGLKAAAEDMLSSYGEWFALAFKVQKNVLLSYANPRGLVWHRDRYVEDNFSADAEEEFDIKGIPLQQWVNLTRFGDKFANRFYGRKFADLPQAMKTGYFRAQVALPAEGIAWPVGRDYFNYRFVVSGCFYYVASRGVRELSAAKRAEVAEQGEATDMRPQGAVASAASQNVKSSTGNAGIARASLEQVLAITNKFPEEISRREMNADLEALYQKPRK